MRTILAVAKNRLLNLRRDRAAFVLAFVLPMAFFTIFAAIFAGSGKSATRQIEVLVADEDQTPNSRRFVEGLRGETGLDVRIAASPPNGKPPSPYTAATAEAAVRRGDAPVALIIPKGFGERPIRFGPAGEGAKLVILADSADPVAPQVLGGLVQKVAMTSMPGAMARAGVDEVDRWSGGLTPEQRARMDETLRALEAEPPPGQPAPKPSAKGESLLSIETRDVVGETKSNPTVAFYAAGFGVMFLLFSASGAGGALIEEAESGTLDRILSTKVDMTRLLLGKLLYLVGVGVAQLALMFVWGALVFKVELAGHVAGFLVMTLATAIACSTFGLLLASLSRSRMQLVAVANLSILLMSALGGSMFPRFLMPAKLQKIGLATINAWAIDGFQKIFWRDEPVWRVWPQVTVLLGVGIVFFLIARKVAERWEAA